MHKILLCKSTNYFSTMNVNFEDPYSILESIKVTPNTFITLPQVANKATESIEAIKLMIERHHTFGREPEDACLLPTGI